MNEEISRNDIDNYIKKLSILAKTNLGFYDYTIFKDVVYITVYNARDVYPISRTVVINKSEIIAIQRNEKLKQIFN